MILPTSIPQGLEYGRVRDILHLTPSDYQIHEIADRLSKINRYCGALKWPLSVATHSVLVSHLCPEGFERAGLLHDITETFGIGDVISPIKRVVPAMNKIEDAIRLQLIGVFPDLAFHDTPEVKHADERAYQLEVFYLRGRPPNREHTSFEFEPLSEHERHIGSFTIEHEITWRQSRDMFMARYEELFL